MSFKIGQAVMTFQFFLIIINKQYAAEAKLIVLIAPFGIDRVLRILHDSGLRLPSLLALYLSL